MADLNEAEETSGDGSSAECTVSRQNVHLVTRRELTEGNQVCEAPNTLPDGTVVACRECWQCRERKVDDWVGRCIAESLVSLRTFSITLTYGRDEGGSSDHIRAALLTYSDVQKYLKRLRKSGYVVRYFAVGEYGAEKGRAHWHLILFFQNNAHVIKDRVRYNAEVAAGRKQGKALPVPVGAVPEHEISTRLPDGTIEDVRFSEAHWPHGWSCWEELHDAFGASAARAVRYVCKYLQKGRFEDEWWQSHMGLSKKPPLGDAWLRQRAAQYVREGLAPQDLFYSWPDVLDAKGKPKRFRLGGVSADNYLDYYLEALHGVSRPARADFDDAGSYNSELWRWIVLGANYRKRPNSEVVEQYLDRLAVPFMEEVEWRRKVEAQAARRLAAQKAAYFKLPPLYGALGFIRPKGGGPI